MSASDELALTLKMVAEVLADAKDDWWITASSAAMLHGVTEPVAADVDVLVSERDAQHLQDKLALLDEEPTPTRSSARRLFYGGPDLR